MRCNSFPFVLVPLRRSLCLFWCETHTKNWGRDLLRDRKWKREGKSQRRQREQLTKQDRGGRSAWDSSTSCFSKAPPKKTALLRTCSLGCRKYGYYISQGHYHEVKANSLLRIWTRVAYLILYVDRRYSERTNIRSRKKNNLIVFSLVLRYLKKITNVLAKMLLRSYTPKQVFGEKQDSANAVSSILSKTSFWRKTELCKCCFVHDFQK